MTSESNPDNQILQEVRDGQVQLMQILLQLDDNYRQFRRETNTSLDRIEHRLDRVEHRLDRVERSIDILRQDTLTMRQDITGLQTENRRILNYIFAQEDEDRKQ